MALDKKEFIAFLEEDYVKANPKASEEDRNTFRLGVYTTLAHLSLIQYDVILNSIKDALYGR